ncbi:SH3 domain-containing protein [Algoriphagus ornithinivorans]|uniref:SH3 domain-containing protein n=1 Tax=Algoriphagus ornithinivorans TaxID=226506 RepID=A0A1I5GSD7_9BACT|nr:C40 family peptidase [Algoriphagus ornithinivorans]SFO38964.1 SH3 domain-containing protein [Algoriphagus ornithinivorans]
MKKVNILVSFLLIIGFQACNTSNQKYQVLNQIEEMRKEVAPDKRVAIWDLQYENGTLSGETDQIEALNQILASLESEGIEVRDEVMRLPSAELGDKTRALVTISVANIRSQPKHSAELATQALLGTPLRVLKKDDSWYLVQTPDGYLSWVDQAGIQLMTEDELANWFIQSKVVFTPLSGHIWQDPSQSMMVSDLVAGNILAVEEVQSEWLEVQLPDGRKGWVQASEVMPWEQWIASREASPTNLVSTAKSMMGIPYLWGGTSIKGVDCSGFTKTIFYLNGKVIPRDASQQVNEGLEVDTDKNWDNLEVGDLLFFGEKATEEKKERVVHVGMWIGNNEFIHSRGRVRISSFDPNSPNYDEYELNRYLRTKRIINQQSDGVISVSELLTSK